MTPLHGLAHLSIPVGLAWLWSAVLLPKSVYELLSFMKCAHRYTAARHHSGLLVGALYGVRSWRMAAEQDTGSSSSCTTVTLTFLVPWVFDQKLTNQDVYQLGILVQWL